MDNSAQDDVAPFFRAWRADPLRVAALAPSGAALARIITREILPEAGPVLELGPGTGVFTRALLARGVPERNLILIEHSSEFADLLRRRFAGARVLAMDAAHLAQTSLLEGTTVGAVISGLPVLFMSPGDVTAILTGAFAHLHRDGSFYQFTYMPFCPISHRLLRRLGLESKRIAGTLWNFPPASVYRISRKVTKQAPDISDRR